MTKKRKNYCIEAFFAHTYKRNIIDSVVHHIPLSLLAFTVTMVVIVTVGTATVISTVNEVLLCKKSKSNVTRRHRIQNGNAGMRRMVENR